VDEAFCHNQPRPIRLGTRECECARPRSRYGRAGSPRAARQPFGLQDRKPGMAVWLAPKIPGNSAMSVMLTERLTLEGVPIDANQ
jgi:hypothetical protein